MMEDRPHDRQAKEDITRQLFEMLDTYNREMEIAPPREDWQRCKRYMSVAVAYTYDWMRRAIAEHMETEAQHGPDPNEVAARSRN